MYYKYYLYKKQVSYDSGTTWQDVVPEELAPSGEPIGSYETLEECEGQTPISGEHLTFIASASGTFTFTPQNSNVIQYSKNGGSWTQGTAVTVNSGDTVMWKGTMTPSSVSGCGKFSSSASFSAKGNPMSLLFGDNFSGQTSLAGKTAAFRSLFESCTNLTSIDDLVLPATTLSESCYERMFLWCSSLTSIPSGFLPSTNLQALCYKNMFQGTSLTSVPSDLLPATTLAVGCYWNMFMSNPSLTQGPDLLASIVAQDAYRGLFANCTSLNCIKCLATDISATDGTLPCTFLWTQNVSSSGTFVKASSMSSWSIGYDGIPSNWTVQNA